MVIGSVLTYAFQHKLVSRQISAAEKTQKELMDLLTEARNMMNTRMGKLTSVLDRLSSRLSNEDRE